MIKNSKAYVKQVDQDENDEVSIDLYQNQGIKKSSPPKPSSDIWRNISSYICCDCFSSRRQHNGEFTRLEMTEAQSQVVR